jgi:hypothetical protein
MTTNEGVSQVVEVVVKQVWDGMSERIIAELKPERVQEWLAAHPEWRLDASGTVLQRIRSFPSAMAAAHFASFVSGLASSSSLPALLKVVGDTVHVSLCPPQSQGQSQAPITETVLHLANHIG